MAQTALKPAADTTVIDRAQLSRMTFGDRHLERELLQLFDRQAAMLIARMQAGAAVKPLAHTLKGSASGIGAAEVARAAEAAELAGADDCRAAVDRLAQAVEAAHALIAELLQARQPL